MGMTIPKEDLLPGERQPVAPYVPPPLPNKQQAERDIEKRSPTLPPPPNPFVTPPGMGTRGGGDDALRIGGGSRGVASPLALGTNPLGVTARPGTTGSSRLLSEIVQTKYTVQSRDYDEFILQRPYDPNDPEYNAALWQQKQAALGRMKKRGFAKDSTTDTPGWLMQQLQQRGLAGGTSGNFRAADRAAGDGILPDSLNTGAQDYSPDFGEEKFNDRRETQSRNQVDFYTKNPYTFVDKNGNVIVDPDTRLPKKTLDPNDPEYEPGVDAYGEPLDRGAFVQSGGAVYMGVKTVQLANGKTIQVATYRNTADMIDDVAGMSVAERQAFQKSIGLPATGVADKKTISAWQTLVLTSAYHTAHGQNYDMNWLKAQLFGTGGGGGGGGGGRRGGGGGGGGGAAQPKMSLLQAKAMLGPTMSKLTGREPTLEEAQAFMAAAQAAFDANPDGWAPEQFALDWVKNRVGNQVGSYQVATNYYEAMLAVLGGGVS